MPIIFQKTFPFYWRPLLLLISLHALILLVLPLIPPGNSSDLECRRMVSSGKLTRTRLPPPALGDEYSPLGSISYVQWHERPPTLLLLAPNPAVLQREALRLHRRPATVRATKPIWSRGMHGHYRRCTAVWSDFELHRHMQDTGRADLRQCLQQCRVS